jgi:uncharacterized protein (DUF433 family)
LRVPLNTLQQLFGTLSFRQRRYTLMPWTRRNGCSCSGCGPDESAKIIVMKKFDRITWNPNQMNGQPCIRGMRLTVRRVVEAVATYSSREDLFRNYPELEAEDVQQALAFAAANLEDRAVETPAA